jgi:hypothetical protein
VPLTSRSAAPVETSRVVPGGTTTVTSRSRPDEKRVNHFLPRYATESRSPLGRSSNVTSTPSARAPATWTVAIGASCTWTAILPAGTCRSTVRGCEVANR